MLLFIAMAFFSIRRSFAAWVMGMGIGISKANLALFWGWLSQVQTSFTRILYAFAYVLT